MKKVFLLAGLATALYFAACTIKPPLPIPAGASLLIAQESPFNAALDVYINGALFSSALPYTANTNYFLSGSGTYGVSFNLAGTDTTIYTTDATGTSSFTLAAGQHYSFFLFDSINTPQYVVVPDNLTAPTGSFSKIRFFQFSPIGKALTDSIVGDSTVDFIDNDSAISRNRSFNDQAEFGGLDTFLTVASGIHNFHLNLDSSANTILTIPQDTLLPGKIYTLLITGLTYLNGTTAGLRGVLIKHN